MCELTFFQFERTREINNRKCSARVFRNPKQLRNLIGFLCWFVFMGLTFFFFVLSWVVIIVISIKVLLGLYCICIPIGLSQTEVYCRALSSHATNLTFLFLVSVVAQSVSPVSCFDRASKLKILPSSYVYCKLVIRLFGSVL